MKYLGLTVLDLLVLAGYFVIITMIGVVASRMVKSREDYLLGGRRFGKLMTIMFTFGAGTHADSAVGVASQCYQTRSLAGFWYQGVMIFTLPIYWLLAPIFRRARVQTTADFFERRFGSGFMLLYAVFAMAILVGFTSMGLYGTAKLVESLTGGQMPWQVVIPVVALVSFFYGIAGGMIAAVWNDFFQGMLTILMSLLLLPFFWGHIGGLEGFRSSVSDSGNAFDLVLQDGMTIQWIIMMSISTLLSMVVQPHIMANAGAAKSEADSRIGFVGGLILKRLMTIPWALTGIMALAMFGPGMSDPDHAFGRLSRELLPSGFGGLMVACVLASVMDNLSVAMISFAGIYTNSIHERRYPASRELDLLRVNRWSSVAFALIVLPAAYAFTDVPQAMRFMFKTVPLMGIAFFMAILWPRANRYGAVMSFVAALAAMLYSQYQLGWVGDAGLPKTVVLYLVAGTLAGYVASMLTPPEKRQTVERFYLLLRTPIGQEQVLRDAGLVEIEGTGTFVDPSAHAPERATDDEGEPIPGLIAVRPSRESLVGFLCVSLITVALVGLVSGVAFWLERG